MDILRPTWEKLPVDLLKETCPYGYSSVGTAKGGGPKGGLLLSHQCTLVTDTQWAELQTDAHV